VTQCLLRYGPRTVVDIGGGRGAGPERRERSACLKSFRPAGASRLAGPARGSGLAGEGSRERAAERTTPVVHVGRARKKSVYGWDERSAGLAIPRSDYAAPASVQSQLAHARSVPDVLNYQEESLSPSEWPRETHFSLGGDAPWLRSCVELRSPESAPSPSSSSGLTYRTSVRIMVRPTTAQRSSSEERLADEAYEAAGMGANGKQRKESLGVLQRMVVKEQFR